MSGIRQCISLNIFLISLKYIKNGPFLKYLIAIIVASLFHVTSLLLIPIYFLLRIKFKSWILVLLVVLGLTVSLIEIKWLIPFLSKVADLLNIQAVTNKLYIYSLRNDPRSYGLGFIFNLIIFIFCIIKRKKLENNEMFNIFLNIYFMSMFFYYFTWELNEFSSRFRLYFSVGNIVLFTYFMDVYSRKLNRFLVFLLIVSYSAYYGRIYFFEMNEGIAYNPYQNYVVHKVFDIKSTGPERFKQYSIVWGK
jgi:hypothetical protein